MAKKLISRSKVSALLGEVASGRSLEMAPIAQAAGVPMISPASTNPKVTEAGDYVFRICFIDPFQGTVMSKFALSKGWKKVAILTDSKQDYSVGLTEFFKKHFTANGGTITGSGLTGDPVVVTWATGTVSASGSNNSEAFGRNLVIRYDPARFSDGQVRTVREDMSVTVLDGVLVIESSS